MDLRRRNAAVAAAQLASGHQFTVNGQTIEIVTEFKYLGRMISNMDDDWVALHLNLTKSRKRWGRVAHILSRDGNEPRHSGMLYKAVLQSVLLHGCETWVFTEELHRALESFHNRVARRISGMMPIRHPDGTWTYPPIADARQAANLETIGEYIFPEAEKDGARLSHSSGK